MAQKTIADTGLVSALVDDSNDNFTELYAATATNATDIDALELEAKIFAYLTTATDTVIAAAATWYFFLSTFTNLFTEGFTVDATGITYTGTLTRTFKVDWKFCGGASDTSEVGISVIKNATFDVDGSVLTGTVIPGACGGSQAFDRGGATGFVSPHSMCVVELATGDKLSLIVKSSEVSNTVTPVEACATINKF